MTPADSDLVCNALRRPQHLLTLTPAGWDMLVRQARRADLLARIAFMLDAQGAIDSVPDAPRAHLKSAILLVEAQHADAARELGYIERALAPTGVRPVLLKGAAYVAAGLLCAMGRGLANIDILVPRNRLPEVEAALIVNGWGTAHHSAYDQRYYREWVHEVPPLRHIERQTVLTVHHAIHPETARLKPDPAKLLAGARGLADPPGFSVLSPVDMVLHGMVELFHNDDLSHALRDLSDLDLLLRSFTRAPGFWADLAERAQELGLTRAVYFGLRYSGKLLATPIPRDAAAAAEAAGPGRVSRALNDMLWTRALRPQHATAAVSGTAAALCALHVRAHWQRMPPLRLLQHLMVKASRLHEPAAASP